MAEADTSVIKTVGLTKIFRDFWLRVKVTAGDLTLIDEVHSGRAYQSHYGTRLHFGLGKREAIDHIEVHWLGGAVEVFKGIKADQCVTLTEGRSTSPLQ